MTNASRKMRAVNWPEMSSSFPGRRLKLGISESYGGKEIFDVIVTDRKRFLICKSTGVESHDREFVP